MSKPSELGEIGQVLGGARKVLWVVGLLSAVVNVLLLGGSLYMMLVYDSVLPSHSIPTLVGLLLMVLMVYIFQGLFDVLRFRLLADVAATMDVSLARRVQQTIYDLALRRPAQAGASSGLAPMRDFDQIRNYLSSPGPAALMDLPWILFFLLILTLLHYWLGLVTLIGAIIMVVLTLIANRQGKRPTEAVAYTTGLRQSLAEEQRRHIEVVHSMGMGDRLFSRWEQANQRYLAANAELTRSSGVLGGISRVFRMFLQSAVLTVGALLVIDGQASGGVIFASSILSARALAPIDQVIANWKNFAATRSAWTRLNALLKAVPEALGVSTVLPAPTKSLAVENLTVVPPGTQRVTVQNVSFQLAAGDALGVVGLSGAGKSSLARALINVWEPARGSVRLDGAALPQWDPQELGSYVGYLPQTVELLSGTIAENIARFQVPIDSEAVVAAAQAAGVHDLIVQMPQGYDTQVGDDGNQLSAGQRQRIGLARALYGDPFLVVLDEPNSNLDMLGEVALEQAIGSVCDRGGIVIVIAHRPAALARCSQVMVMRAGAVEAMGPRDEILARLGVPKAVKDNRAGGQVDQSGNVTSA